MMQTQQSLQQPARQLQFASAVNPRAQSAEAETPTSMRPPVQPPRQNSWRGKQQIQQDQSQHKQHQYLNPVHQRSGRQKYFKHSQMKPRSNSYSGATSSAAPPLSRPRKKVVVVLSPFIRAPTPKTSTATTAATTTAGNINIKEKGRDAQISINSAVASVGQQLLSPRSALKSSILDRLGPRVSHPISSTFPQTTSALNFENAPSFAHTTDPNPAPSMAQLRAKWRRKSPHQKSTTTSRNKPNRQKQESQSLTATPSKFAPRRRRRANSAKSKTALSLIREQNDALLQAAIMRAEEFAASLNSQGISADSQTDPHHQPLDLGRDEFRQLMRENGLRNHGFVTLITREDLIHGDDCSENGGSDDEYDNYDIFGGWQSDGSYEPSINDDDDNNDNDPVDGQEQTEQGQIKNSTSISSGGSRSSFDEGYDPENPEMQDHEEGDEDDSFDLGEIDSEIDAALTSMGITAGSISDMSMETRHQQLQLPQNQKEVLIQVFAEDGRPLGTPVIATRSLTGNEIVYSNFIDGTPATSLRKIKASPLPTASLASQISPANEKSSATSRNTVQEIDDDSMIS